MFRLHLPSGLARLPAALVLLLPGAAGSGGPPPRAADLIEPWEAGFSDVEFHAIRGGHGGGAGTAVFGFGLPASFSLGAAFTQDDGDGASYGLCGSWTRRAAGVLEIDLFGALDVHRSPDVAVDGERTWLVGTEWSVHRWRTVPYARLEVVPGDAGGRGIAPLAGLMVPVGRGLQMHVELAADVPWRGPWPLRLALGPNVTVGPGVEILPEVAVALDAPRGAPDWQMSVGVVLNPRAHGPILARQRPVPVPAP